MKRIFLATLFMLFVGAFVFVACAQPQAPAAKPVPAPATVPSASPSASPTPSAAPAPSQVSAPTPAKPIELRLSHHNPPTGRTTVKSIDPWAKAVEEATKGRVKIIMYPAQSLASSTQNLEATISGLADIGWLLLGNWTGRFPLTEVTNLPFMPLPSGHIDGREVWGKWVNSRIIQELYNNLPEVQAEFADMKLLQISVTDAYFLATNKKPVANRTDLKGMKIRALGKGPTEMWKLLGAVPVNLPMPDIYDACQRGVIDGASLNWSPVATYRFYEVTKYWTDVGTDVALSAYAMNKAKWNSLPTDIQQAIMSVNGIKGVDMQNEADPSSSVYDDVMADMKKANRVMQKVDLDPGEYDKWQSIGGKPVWDSWLAEMKGKGLNGQKVLDEMLRLKEKYK